MIKLKILGIHVGQWVAQIVLFTAFVACVILYFLSLAKKGKSEQLYVKHFMESDNSPNNHMI